MKGLKRVLDRLGLKQSEFAELLDVSPRTVSLWVTGEVTLPGPVRAYLRLLQHAEPAVRSAELARLSCALPVFEDGLYSLTYDTSSGGYERADRTSGVALLRRGRIVGSDAGGAKFEGTYQFDSTRRTNHFHVWLRVPPAGELVTGFDAGDTGATVEVVADLDRADPVASTVVHIGGRPLGLTLAYLGPLPG
jgi:transcriptional regulator with XRE-family HTH domain